jgi:predicted unusual protein kinase regulating ubiquinone biosynthesis (AarF/ABC1/UbiB family)
MKKFKSSRLSRITKMGGTIAKVGGQLAMDFAKEKSGQLIEKSYQKAQEVHATTQQIKAAKELISSMGELKGGFMKVGQMLSITEDLILPKEITELFKTLQKDAPKMSDLELDKVFEEDFGKKPEEIFESFDRTAIAAASIGQVHKATLNDGTVVAVKVQYPEIVNAVKSDLMNINQLDKLINLIFPSKPDIEHVLEEVKNTMLQECDYKLEAKNMTEFAKVFEEFPDILIPKVFTDFSSERVLTTEFMDGDHFDKTLSYTQDERNNLGELLYQSYLHSFFGNKLLHTDPQEGNYLFRRDKIIIMDFGSVKKFSNEFVHNYTLMIKAITEKNIPMYRKSTEYLRITQPQYPEETITEYMEVADAIYRPFLDEGKYSVQTVNPFQIIKSFIGANFNKLKGKQAPREEFVLLDRANIGIFTKLTRWKSEVDWQGGKRKYQVPVEEQAVKEIMNGE